MVDVAGGGHVGLAIETSHGTYAVPAVFAPIISETLTETRNDPIRRPILGRAVNSGKVSGRSHAEGEIVIEALPTTMVYFLAASRWAITKAGAGPYTYTAQDGSDAHVKGNNRSLTIAIDRAGVGFASFITIIPLFVSPTITRLVLSPSRLRLHLLPMRSHSRLLLLQGLTWTPSRSPWKTTVSRSSISQGSTEPTT